MPEAGKDFPLLNNMNVISNSASAAGPSGALADSAWDRRPRDDDDDVKEDDTEVEEEESNVLGEGEGKVWRTKRTLRK